MSETSWIEWTGGECPVPNAFGREYELRMRGDSAFVIRPLVPAAKWRWSHKDRATDIVAYKVIGRGD